MKRYLLLAGWIGMFAGSSCTKTVHPANGKDSTYYGRLSFVISNNATFRFYDSALTHTGLLDTLSQAGPYTLLVPNNDAFGGYFAFGNSTPDLNALIFDIGLQDLPAYTAYDIVRGRYDLRSLPLENNMELPSITGGKVWLTRYLQGTDTMTTVNGLQLISLDNGAANGELDVMSASVLAPDLYATVWDQLQTDTSYAYFVAAAQRVHLDTLLKGTGPVTVLAPNNQAFQDLVYFGLSAGVNTSSLDSILAADPVRLRQVIGYHILPGRYFMNDFLRTQLPGDTLFLNTVSGETISFFGTVGSPPPFMDGTVYPTFYGRGNQGRGITIYHYYNGCYGSSCYYSKEQDFPAGNGVVHMMNSVLIP